MAKKLKPKSKPTLRKLSPQLNLLLALGLPALRKQCLAERAERMAQHTEIAELSKQLAVEKSQERRKAIEHQIGGLLAALPNSLVHGVHFPTDKELKGDAPPAKLKTPFVSAFIKAHCTYADLQRLGIRVRQQAGDIFTAFIPVRLLKRLASMPGIDFVELARPVRSDLNNALPYSQISNLQAPPTSLSGAGVIVGVVDSFLFFYHPDFRNNDGAGGDGQGSSRVLFIWDQSLTPQAGESGPTGIAGFVPGGGATYGVEYSQANINTDLNNFGPPPAAGQLPTNNAYQTVRHQTAVVNTNNAHGTHVSGIAAGNGRAQGGTFTGAAPGSSIIFVRDIVNNIAHADATTVTDAFAYIFARAALLGQPCVVNMSQSDNMGPHDGTSLGEQFLDNLLLTPGRAIAVAAGNTNNQSEHTSGAVPAGGSTNVTLNFFGNAPFNEFAEIWYDGHDAFSVTLTIPTVPATVIGPIAPGAASPVTALPNGVSVQIVHTQNDPRNGDNVISLFIRSVGALQTIPNGNWVFQLNGTTVINGTFEGWVDRNNRGFRAWAAPDTTSNSIAVPASGLRVIAVGSHDLSGPPPNIVASSSVGPSRDNRIKPDISAVGSNVTSTWYQAINTVNPGVAYAAIGGTSMASPMVAGTAALLFQCRGAGLTWSDIKQILQDTAGVPAIGVPSNPFGWGFLQAANACAGPIPDVDVWIRDHATDTGVEPFTGSVTWLSPDIEVLDLAGNPVSNPTHDPANFINNLVRVTVRNRGALTARNIEVHLYWADPGTNILFPADWQLTAIYTGDPNFVVQSNKIIIPQLGSGASTTVRFGWAPPAPGSNVRGDDHFCLIARLEQEDDASNVAGGGWSVIAGSNNIALRNTHVQEAAGGGGDTAFYVTGSDDHDALEIDTDKLEGRIELIFPVQALPWRDLTLINQKGRRHPFGADCGDDPLAARKRVIKGGEATLRTGIEGVSELRLEAGNAHIVAAAGRRLTIPHIRIKPGVRMPVRLLVRGAKIGKSSGFAHVRQRSGGRIIGGVTLELAHKVVKARAMSARLEDGRLIIR